MKPATETISQTSGMQQLSLYKIEREMLELMDLRETAKTEEEKAAADQQIALYVQAEVRKVDGILAYMRHCKHRAAAAFAEGERLQGIGRKWARRQERLEAATLRAMVDSNTRALEGNLGSFTVRKNPPSVDPEINMDLLPERYTKVTVTMPGSMFRLLQQILMKVGGYSEVLAKGLRETVERVPIKADIAAELKRTESCGCVEGIVYGPEGAGAPCENCDGSGRVPVRIAGARLIVDKVRLEVR